METEAQLIARQAEIQMARAMLAIEEQEVVEKRMRLAGVIINEVVETPGA